MPRSSFSVPHSPFPVPHSPFPVLDVLFFSSYLTAAIMRWYSRQEQSLKLVFSKVACPMKEFWRTQSIKIFAKNLHSSGTVWYFSHTQWYPFYFQESSQPWFPINLLIACQNSHPFWSERMGLIIFTMTLRWCSTLGLFPVWHEF